MPTKSLSDLHIDEIQEFAVYDSPSKVARRDLLMKRIRKSYVGTPITLKVAFKNELGVSLVLEKITLLCKYTSGQGTYTSEAMSVTINPCQVKDVLIQVVPESVGDFEIQNIQWELFDVIQCKKKLQSSSSAKGKPDSYLKFKIIEASTECEAELILSNQDIKSDKVLFYSEQKEGILRIRNCSSTTKLRQAFITCSHPMLFNFQNLLLFNELDPSGTFELPIQMRAPLIGFNTIKFLIRYEIDMAEEVPVLSRFRFQRLVVDFKTQQIFAPNYRVNISSRIPNAHLVNLSI